MGEYQKEFALQKLDVAVDLLEKMLQMETSEERGNYLMQVIDLIRKAKEHIANV